MGVVLALASALLYGVSDYLGGRATRRLPAAWVSLVGELAVLGLALMLVPLIETSLPSRTAIAWSLVAGVVGSAAVVGLYIALARGNMTLVAPVTGVVAAALPVSFGVLSGERPGWLATAGIAVGIVAVALIGGGGGSRVGQRRSSVATDPRPARPSNVTMATILLAIVVGAGFGLLFVALERTGDSGLWPLFFARFGGVPVLMAAVLVGVGVGDHGARRVPAARRSLLLTGSTIGVLIAVGNLAYLWAVRQDQLSIVAVIASMYPVSTVALAAAVDGERATSTQVAGMGCAAAAVLLITSQ